MQKEKSATSHTDRFWTYFWALAVLILAGVVSWTLVLFRLNDPIRTANVAALGAAFDSSRDPFERERAHVERPQFTGNSLYEDSLPLAFEDWSWSADVDWSAKDAPFDGYPVSIHATFFDKWAGVRAEAEAFDVSAFNSLSLAVMPDGNVKDLYIELFDRYGRSLGRQSVGWYVPGGALVPGTWNIVDMPLENLFPQGQAKRPITGYAIEPEEPGDAHIAAIRLETNMSPFSGGRWYPPAPQTTAPQEEAVDPVPLPYDLQLAPDGMKLWRTVFGRFELVSDGVMTGPIAEKTTGSMAYLAGGKAWEDYRADATVYWGPTESIALLVRYKDDSNFVACTFSNYGQLVFIYDVHDGISTPLGQTPGLAIRTIEPWKDARHGASVSGDRVSCYQDDVRVLSATIPDIASAGTVGFETWTQNSYDVGHRIEKFSVRGL